MRLALIARINVLVHVLSPGDWGSSPTHVSWGDKILIQRAQLLPETPGIAAPNQNSVQ